MAKTISLIELQGTYGGITFVKSSTYGNHIRAKRGTRKKAELNEAYKKQNEKLVKSNTPAKIIKSAIDPYRRDFYDGSLWARLSSMTNEQDLDGGMFDFTKLKPFEINKAYPLDRFFNLGTKTTVDGERSELHVELTYDAHPAFPELTPVDGYRFGVIAIFPDLENKNAKTAAVYSDIIQRAGTVTPLHFQVPVPPVSSAFLICVRIDGYEKGKVYHTRASKGMRVVEVGLVG